ncbi:ras guanine nucleotide exchange factor domain-containing protein [Sporodiniella umbellata]|nr:ras guanine nucleotide exchange factor domain-containing protein [Sporodiniella umbellata]
MSRENEFPKILCRVKALYPFRSSEKSSLSFEKDEYIDVLSQLDSGWWDGWCRGNRGWFPSNYVQISEMSPREEFSNTEEDDKTLQYLHSIKNKSTSNNDNHRTSLLVDPNSRPLSLALEFPTATIQSPLTSNNRALPEGWTLQIADDGVTEFYYNQHTGGLRWNHPALLDSDEEEELSSLSEDQHTQEAFDEYQDFGRKEQDQQLPQQLPPPPTRVANHPAPINLMEHWSKRTTPQGKVYFANSITQETTWNFNEIDQETGRLMEKKNSQTDYFSNSQNGLLEEDEPQENTEDKLMTWKSIAIDIVQSVQSLHKSITAGDSSTAFRQKITVVVDTVRLMLYSSRSLDKEAAHLQDPEIKEPHRNVLASLAKLILSAKAINESNFDQNGKVQRDSTDVLNSARKFVLICQDKNVPIRAVNPRLIFNTSEDTQSISAEDESEEGKSRSNNSGIKPKYPLNQDLIVSLQTHAKQIVGSTDALCRASTYISQLDQKESNTEVSKNNNLDEDGEEQKHVLEERARSNVILLFQNLSSQIGTYLNILNEIDMRQIDTDQLQSLPNFLNNKQELYNGVGLLFSAVQALTNTQNDISTSVNSVEQTVSAVENIIEEIHSAVVQMVGDRKIWMMRSGENGVEPTEGERIHRPSRGSLTTDDNSELGTPIISRFYNRQNSQGSTGSQRPSISQSGSNLTRPVNDKTSSLDQESFDERHQFWYLGYNYADSDIAFTAEGGVKGGTLSALVERLTLHNAVDMSFIANFLLTYRSFCTTEQFLDLLQERYNMAPPDELTPVELEIWTDKKQKLVRLRVFNIMKSWLENYYNEEDEFILNKLQFFANTVICDSSSLSAEQLNRLIRKRREQDEGGLKKLIPNELNGPMPIVPKDLNHIRLLDTEPLEMARQLSIMDFKLYSSIRPIECLGKAWSREDDSAVNVKQSIDYCNKLTAWVTGSILSYKEPKKRAVSIKYWSQVANRCLELHNYNTCMAVLSAFDNSAVGRLKKTWELVSGRTTQSLSYIRRLMGSNRNFQEYRDMIHSVNPPCIPFLGIYLQDLTFIEDGNPHYLKKSSNLINFAKQQKSAEVIREIKQFQSPPYVFQHVPEIQDFIKDHLDNSKDVDFLYERSLELEPRHQQTEQ